MTRTVLYVDDSSDDLMLMKLACRNACVSFRVQDATGGEAAISYLEEACTAQDPARCPVPDLVLLDLKMPVFSGFDVLTWLRTRPSMQVPVVVFTSSIQQKDQVRAFELGAREFLVKPAGYSALIDLAKALDAILSESGSLDFAMLRKVAGSYPGQRGASSTPAA